MHRREKSQMGETGNKMVTWGVMVAGKRVEGSEYGWDSMRPGRHPYLTLCLGRYPGSNQEECWGGENSPHAWSTSTACLRGGLPSPRAMPTGLHQSKQIPAVTSCHDRPPWDLRLEEGSAEAPLRFCH